jgi:D-lactate dehydrogenase (cytochrome)
MNDHDFFSDVRELGIPVVRSGFESYLRDESRFQGSADGLVRALQTRHVVDVLALAARWNVPITVVSGKTSLTGACVPVGGVVLDVRRLDFIDARDPSRIGPGVILGHYKDHVAGMGLFYPPDPTSEESCTLGGNVACNASGALSYLYGPTRNYVRGLKLVLASGSILDLERGQVVSHEGFFAVPAHRFVPESSGDLLIPVPRRGAPAWNVCKSAAGLYAADPMDLIDLFIGSEGILGVVVEIRTLLIPRRNPFFGLLLYLPSRDVTVALVRLLDTFKRVAHDGETGRQADIARYLQILCGNHGREIMERFRSIVPSCMEWFSSSVERFLSPGRASRLKKAYGCLYVEQEFRPEEDPLEVASEWAELVDLINRNVSDRQGPIETEVALEEKHIRQMRLERKGIPEKLNELIRPGMVKIGMDFSVPLENLDRLIQLYEDNLPAGKSYIFGHMGNAHLHVNIVPETKQEEQAYRDLARSLAREICAMSGSVSGEHGIGKIKRESLTLMLGQEGIDEITEIKRILDPKGILNRDNIVRVPDLSHS